MDMDIFEDWLEKEIERHKLDAGMLSEKGLAYKEALQLVKKMYMQTKKQNEKVIPFFEKKKKDK